MINESWLGKAEYAQVAGRGSDSDGDDVGAYLGLRR